MCTDALRAVAHSKVADILICATEILQMPVRRSDEEPLQKLTAELRGELDVKARSAQRAFVAKTLRRLAGLRRSD